MRQREWENTSGVVTDAFLVVFGITGVLITAGFQTITDTIPWLAPRRPDRLRG